MMGSHGSIPVLLVTAAVGYWVLTLAAKEKEGTKKIGHLVGLIIIVVSLLGAACKIYCQVSGSSCPMEGHRWGKKGGMFCPMTGKQMPAPEAPAGSQQ